MLTMLDKHSADIKHRSAFKTSTLKQCI